MQNFLCSSDFCAGARNNAEDFLASVTGANCKFEPLILGAKSELKKLQFGPSTNTYLMKMIPDVKKSVIEKLNDNTISINDDNSSRRVKDPDMKESQNLKTNGDLKESEEAMNSNDLKSLSSNTSHHSILQVGWIVVLLILSVF